MMMTRFVGFNPYTRFNRSIRLDGSQVRFIKGVWFRVRIDGFGLGFIRFFSGIDGINRSDRCNRVFSVARLMDGITGVKGLR